MREGRRKWREGGRLVDWKVKVLGQSGHSETLTSFLTTF